MKKVPLGPLGETLMVNMKRFREAQRLSYVEISTQLDALGRPIPVIGLRRIEMGERRVDIDEVAALARVLGVPPLMLLLPVGQAATVELFAGEERPTWALAKWFIGDAAYPPSDVPPELDPLVGTPEDNQAWATNSTAVVFHRDHDRMVVNWRWAAGQTRVRGAAKEVVEKAAREVAETERALGELRQNMVRRGVTPPPLPDDLRHVDGVAKPQGQRGRRPSKS